MQICNKKKAVECRPSDSDLSSKSEKPMFIVTARQQNAEEQHRFRTATDALLAELVRQHLGRKGS